MASLISPQYPCPLQYDFATPPVQRERMLPKPLNPGWLCDRLCSMERMQEEKGCVSSAAGLQKRCGCLLCLLDLCDCCVNTQGWGDERLQRKARLILSVPVKVILAQPAPCLPTSWPQPWERGPSMSTEPGPQNQNCPANAYTSRATRNGVILSLQVLGWREDEEKLRGRE